MELFRDPIPELKRQVGVELARAMSDASVTDLVEILEIDPPRVSDLKRCKLQRYSFETLIRYAHRLGSCATISFGAPAFKPATRSGPRAGTLLEGRDLDGQGSAPPKPALKKVDATF